MTISGCKRGFVFAPTCCLGLIHLFTGEGSPTYAWMLYLWQKIPQNTYLTEPNVLVPHLIRHILPNVKLIVTLRDPVERFELPYFFKKNR